MKKTLLILSVSCFVTVIQAQSLYDQTANVSSSGVISDYMTDNGSIVKCADNFVVPTNATWEVTSVTVRGFRNNAGPSMDSMLVEIYNDASGLPGTVVYSEIHMLGAGGVPAPQADTAITIDIPMQTLTEGTYWLSVAGYAPQDNRWNWLGTTGTAINGQAVLLDVDDVFSAGATTWTGFTSLGLADPNLAFTINGTDYVLNVFENEVNFSIYPNPASDILFIQNGATPIQNIIVYDLDGKIVLQSSNIESSVDISILNEGVYIIQIHTEAGSMNTRFVKM